MTVFDNIVQESVNEIALESQFQRTIGQKIKEMDKELSTFQKEYKKAVFDKNEKLCLEIIATAKQHLIELRESVQNLDVSYDTKDKVLDNLIGVFKIIIGFIIMTTNIFKNVIPMNIGQLMAQAIVQYVKKNVGVAVMGFGILDLVKEKDPKVIKGGIIESLNVEIECLDTTYKQVKKYGISKA